jgi:transcription initiation factor IIF auxiliary subunit
MLMQVTFELHETFATPRRVIDQQPFEVTEFGWGEFDIGITVCQPEASKIMLSRSRTVPHRLNPFNTLVC